MLKEWATYKALKAQSPTPPEYTQSLTPAASDAARLVSLKALHQGEEGLILLPAYAQTEYIYDDHAIVKADEERYHHTPTVDRVNQFDAMGPSYNPAMKDITIEYRLGLVASKAASLAATEPCMMRADGSLTAGALVVIDALRTVDATYLLAAANPLAIENKLLSMPGTSAHNKGMAIDLGLAYWDEEREAWCDADTLGHMDHPDMVTNHRNYANVSDVQKHNRLTLERLMLRGAFENGMLLAPLREEFWDFRFPEDGLDLWRVLEAISRAAQIESAFETCSSNVENIRSLYRAGNKEKAYAQFELDNSGFAKQCLELFGTAEAREMLQANLHITPEQLGELELVYHGEVGLVFDEDLPEPLRQANPELKHLFG